jgi:hypothetical protein
MPFESDFKQQTPQDEAAGKPSRPDRKLGDEWTDWDGTSEEDINENKGRFVLMTAVVWVVYTLVVILGGYLIEPRLNQWSLTAQCILKVGLITLIGGGLTLYGMIMLEVFTEKVSLLPYGWSERMILWLLPKATWFGGRLGMSKDRIANSFVQVNNALTRSHAKRVNQAKLLILLPRCLNKDTRLEIRALLEGQPHSLATAGGGEEARKAIRENRPSFIIAVACERDLVSGIRDVALHIPVIGIPNKRPQGPCKNTHIDIEEFRRALQFFKDPQSHNASKAIAN